MKARPIPGFEKEYVITRDGRVFRRLKDGFKELSPATNDDGYKTTVLYKGGQPTFKYIHQLVADTYHENPDDKPIVNHKDGDKTNDDIDNLEFADESENTQHAYRKGLAKGPKGEVNGKSKLTAAQVKAIKNSDQTGEELALKYGVSPAAISLIRSGKRW